MRRIYGLLVLIMVSVGVLVGCSSPRSSYTATVDGAVQRDLSGGEIFYEDNEFSRQIYIQKTGPGAEDIMVLVMVLPGEPREVQHALVVATY